MCSLLHLTTVKTTNSPFIDGLSIESGENSASRGGTFDYTLLTVIYCNDESMFGREQDGKIRCLLMTLCNNFPQGGP
jgi:hypothetical protein